MFCENERAKGGRKIDCTLIFCDIFTPTFYFLICLPALSSVCFYPTSNRKETLAIKETPLEFENLLCCCCQLEKLLICILGRRSVETYLDSYHWMNFQLRSLVYPYFDVIKQRFSTINITVLEKWLRNSFSEIMKILVKCTSFYWSGG